MTPRGLAVLLAIAALPGAAFAQDSTVVVPGPEYAAGSTRAFLLGTSYRDLWTTPVRVPLLNLGTFAGGLTPTERGGGNQTVSLRFRGADGKEYAFRSVNKRQWRAQEADLKGTVVGRVLQDQVSSQQPSGLVVSGRLMDATGALHVDPVLFVMPNDPRLGEYRQEFAGMLGTVEERPEAPWAGAAEIEGTDDMLEALEEGPRNRLADEEDPRQVRPDDLVPGRLVHLEKRRTALDPRVVDQDVERPDLRLDPGERRLDFVPPRHVEARA